MSRKIIRIDTEKCNGCGLCAEACHEGAIALRDGKAELLWDDYCDGFGDCLPVCPMDAIAFVEREAAAYDASSVAQAHVGGGCPSAQPEVFTKREVSTASCRQEAAASELGQWPVQIRLIPANAPFLQGADLLVAADCTAFACGDFHERFMRGRVTLVGCPKLDPVDYAERLSAIVAQNEIRSITVVLMEVPCCTGLGRSVFTAVAASGREIPCRTVIVTTDGYIEESSS
jgi:Pyruvate/2-oxoacid:ferredoxin oxidoreductase delta subunit